MEEGWYEEEEDEEVVVKRFLERRLEVPRSERERVELV